MTGITSGQRKNFCQSSRSHNMFRQVQTDPEMQEKY